MRVRLASPWAGILQPNKAELKTLHQNIRLHHGVSEPKAHVVSGSVPLQDRTALSFAQLV